MLYSILVGIGMTAFTVILHALGTSAWMQWLVNRKLLGRRESPWRKSLRALCVTAVVILMLHIVEVSAWALAYLLLPDISELTNFNDAIYFSIVTFTTLGYGDITLTGEWRLLSGIEAMNGIILFGWSTALLFAIVQRLWNFESRDT